MRSRTPGPKLRGLCESVCGPARIGTAFKRSSEARTEVQQVGEPLESRGGDRSAHGRARLCAPCNLMSWAASGLGTLGSTG